ncbi:MAG: hypothetical protein ACRDN0_02320, partial [Trebonia sp.]
MNQLASAITDILWRSVGKHLVCHLVRPPGQILVAFELLACSDGKLNPARRVGKPYPDVTVLAHGIHLRVPAMVSNSPT